MISFICILRIIKPRHRRWRGGCWGAAGREKQGVVKEHEFQIASPNSPGELEHSNVNIYNTPEPCALAWLDAKLYIVCILL